MACDGSWTPPMKTPEQIAEATSEGVGGWEKNGKKQAETWKSLPGSNRSELERGRGAMQLQEGVWGRQYDNGNHTYHRQVRISTGFPSLTNRRIRQGPR
jgi:hypothetical protein